MKGNRNKIDFIDLITDFDCDITLALCYEDVDFGQVDRLLALDNGPHGVLKELEHDVMHVRRGVDYFDRSFGRCIVVDLRRNFTLKWYIPSA